MAGEWIPIDIALDQKPEVLELCDITGEVVDVVVYRLYKMWGWASLNTADGTARATPDRLARVCGGDAAFWLAVQAVGWLAFDPEAGTATIPGFDRRFSSGAKARASNSERASRYRRAQARRERDDTVAHKRDATVTRGEERTVSSSSSSTRVSDSEKQEAAEETAASPIASSDAWLAFRDAWNLGGGAEWRNPNPPPEATLRLVDAEWMAAAPKAIDRLKACRYFDTPVTLWQFLADGFVDRVLGGQYDSPKEPRRRSGRPDDRPPPQAFGGSDAARFEATRRKLEERRRREGAA